MWSRSGIEPARVDRRAGGESLERARPGRHRLLGQLVGARGGGGEDRVRGHRALERLRVLVVRVPERHELGQRTVRQRSELGIDERLVRARRAADGLGRVVDQDVERPGGGDILGEPDDLRRIAQVDADDLEPVDPLGRIGQAAEAAHGVAREARRDRRVRAVAQQAQRDVHADLRAAAGEQRALAGEVGARVALRVAHRRAGRAQLVVERVDDRVGLLADVAGARLDQRARGRRGRRGADRDAARLVVDAVGRAGRGRGDHVAVGLGDRVADLAAAHLLHGLEHRGGRLAHGDEVGVGLVETGHAVEHPQGGREVGRVDAARRQVGGGGGLGEAHAILRRRTWARPVTVRP